MCVASFSSWLGSRTHALELQNILPRALERTTSDIRERLLEEDVQKVYGQYSKKLFKAFQHYARQDKRDHKEAGLQTINTKEYEIMLTVRLLDSIARN